MIERELLFELSEIVQRAQSILARHLPPDSGNSAEDAISELLGLLDGPQLREVQSKVREALAQPAFFAND